MECGIFVATVQMTPEGAGCVANLDVMLWLIVVYMLDLFENDANLNKFSG